MFQNHLSDDTFLSKFTFHQLYTLSIFTASISVYMTQKQLTSAFLGSDRKSKVYIISMRSRVTAFLSSLIFSAISFDPLNKLNIIPLCLAKPINVLWHLAFTLWVIIILQIIYTTTRFIETNLAYQINDFKYAVCYTPPVLISVAVIFVCIARRCGFVSDDAYKLYKIASLVIIGVLNLALVLLLAGVLIRLFGLVTQNTHMREKTRSMVRMWKVFLMLLMMLNVMYCFSGVVMIEKLLVSKEKDTIERNEKMENEFIKVKSNDLLFWGLRLFGMFIQVFFGMVYKGIKKKNKLRIINSTNRL